MSRAEVVEIRSSEDRLTAREARIESRHKAAFIDNGLELAAIRDEGDYKAAYGTFENYVEQRWDMTPQRAGQVINAAFLSKRIETIVSISPTRETHVRPLLQRLDNDNDRVTVWREVVECVGQQVRAKDVEEAVERHLANKAKNWITIDEWKSLDADQQDEAMRRGSSKTLNKQDNASIEWAQWSWNPITGCKHDCPYCYARDIANRFYPQKFEPSIYPERFAMPANTSVPAQAAKDPSFRNVFTCSMADLFGRWVPSEWINRVLDTVRNNPQWNFLFLTKFPKRMAEFDIPENAWMGTSVDCQARVKAAEEGFAGVRSGVRWLSIEPMLEPLQFSRLDLFQWVVIGGASRSSQTPAWCPPMDWIVNLHAQARAAGCSIYYKTNAFTHSDVDYDKSKPLSDNRLREFPWGDLVQAPTFAPEVFRYLGKAG